MNTVIVFTIATAVHFMFCSPTINDLFTKSERSKKAAWLALIVFLPVLGIVFYNMTKQRQRVF